MRSGRSKSLASRVHSLINMAFRNLRRLWLGALVLLIVVGHETNGLGSEQVSNTVSHLPTMDSPSVPVTSGDFLIDEPTAFQVQAFRNEDGHSLILDNGLIRRTWRLSGDFANVGCVGFDNLMTGQSMIRSLRPELSISIDGKNFEIGGMAGQPNHAFMTAKWIKSLAADQSQTDAPKTEQQANATLVSIHVADRLTPRLKWQKRRHVPTTGIQWPPRGREITMLYRLDAGGKPDSVTSGEIEIEIHYEMYDGLPLLSKWAIIRNNSDQDIVVDSFTLEQLAVVEHSNWVEARKGVALPKPDYLHVETDFAFGGFNHQNANRHVVHWKVDPLYTTQVNYLKQSPCLLNIRPTYGPNQKVKSSETFETFRTWELVFDSSDRERRGLTLKKMYRSIAPWVTENPITHHLVDSNPQAVRKAIDQAKEVGFEAVIMSFGSGFEMESTDKKYLQQWKQVADYAAQQGIELGSYSLFSSRHVGDEHQIVCPEGESPTHGKCPAATSAWGIEYYAKLKSFYESTGFDQFEHDGPYPGDVDTTPRPPHQSGVLDSRWAQWRIVTDLYRHLRATGVYINAPDYYYLSGSNKCGMGYREVNWSLPRAQQVIHTRQNIFDGSWTKTPSMGWMFVPLSEYHGGGAAATIEPLSQHLEHYDRLMKSNLAMGVQAHYRGPRLYDSEQTKQIVKANVAWFRKFRDILESDFIHGRRADGQQLDWVLHVNPRLEEKGMLCVFNPLEKDVTQKLRVPLYYTGLTDVTKISHEDADTKEHRLGRKHDTVVDVTVPAGGMSWWVVR